jgi:hypothetical protein
LSGYLDGMDMDEASAIWRLWLARRQWEQTRTEAEATGDTAGALAAEHALVALPAVGVLDALRVNAQLVSVLTAERWIAMKTAQEQGVSAEQIGKALEVTRQSAWEFMQRKIAAHQQQPLTESTTRPPIGDAARDRTRGLMVAPGLSTIRGERSAAGHLPGTRPAPSRAAERLVLLRRCRT